MILQHDTDSITLVVQHWQYGTRRTTLAVWHWWYGTGSVLVIMALSVVLVSVLVGVLLLEALVGFLCAFLSAPPVWMRLAGLQEFHL